MLPFKFSNQYPTLLTHNHFQTYLALAEEFFHTDTDSEQINIKQISLRDEKRLFPYTLNLIFQGRRVIGGTDILPCTHKQMLRFLDHTLSETALLSAVVKDFTNGILDYASCDAIYLVSAFILPKYRRRGLAIAAFEDSIRRTSIRNPTLFAWGYTSEGSHLSRKLAKNLGLALRVK